MSLHLSKRSHLSGLLVLLILGACLAAFTHVAIPGHDHHDEQQCAVCAWLQSLMISLSTILLCQLCFVRLRRILSSRTPFHTLLLLPDGRAPPAS